ncbi:GNAT family N-acetyltransferase [Actinokineospora auranticolor]|uniref:Putative N-acyltransferase n=1 Tax=Actinokineospora auranticolor TaxID=155976 RepID=A0A2S6GJ84_9PSEU|nr:GNAT family N-acetyltransferase [Actinokineospora auranticolor]PPK65216.1 putative N-acyltransferase [Actinokineospora auranticolor]
MPEDLRVEVVDRPDHAEWDALAGRESFYAGTRWLAFQRALEPNAHAYHVCVRSGDRLVAAVAVFALDRPSRADYHPHRLFPDITRPDATPVTLIGGTNGYLSAPLGGAAAPLPLLLDAVDRITEEHSAGLGWWLYTTSEHAATIAERAGVVPRLHAWGECVVDLPGAGFDDYLGGLSRSRREAVRRDLRGITRSGLTVERTRLSTCHERCGWLLAQTMRKYDKEATPEDMAEWLDKLNGAAADTGQVYLCRDERRQVIGFSLAYAEGTTDYMRVAGFDYANAPHVGEYFQLLFYEPIRDAYQRGATALHVGSGSTHAKARRGARVRPLWAVPTRAEAWDVGTTTEHNRRRASELRAELPNEDLVWAHGSEEWLRTP